MIRLAGGRSKLRTIATLATISLWAVLMLLGLPGPAHIVCALGLLALILFVAFSLAKPGLVIAAIAFRALIVVLAFGFIQPFLASNSGLDGIMYDEIGQETAPALHHELRIPDKYPISLGTDAYATWTGIFYFAAGSSWPLMQVFNSLLGLIGSLLFYNVIRPGKLVTAFLFFDPSLTLFTSMHNKDPYTYLFLALWLYGLTRMRTGMQIAGIVGMLLVRPYMLPVGIGAGLVALWKTNRQWMWGAYLAALCTGCLFALLNLPKLLPTLADTQASLSWGESSLVAGDLTSISGVLAYLPTGLAAVLFRPFPLEGANLFIRLTSIYQVVLSAAVLYVVAMAWKHRKAEWSPQLKFSLTFCVLFTLLFALISGNIGTIAREKAQMIPFLWCAAVLLHRISLNRAASHAVAVAEVSY